MGENRKKAKGKSYMELVH